MMEEIIKNYLVENPPFHNMLTSSTLKTTNESGNWLIVALMLIISVAGFVSQKMKLNTFIS